MQSGVSIAATEEQLAGEDGALSDLLGHFRDFVSPVLIGDRQWIRVLERAAELPVTMAALPFGFELPLHSSRPEADFGVSLASGTSSAAHFLERTRADGKDRAAQAVARLFARIDAANSPLREIVGRKLMLEYDIGSAPGGESPLPGIFLIPSERPIIGGRGQTKDAGMVVDALVSCLGWKTSDAERETVERVYLAQPENTRMESFGVFPSRARAIRLAIMGFESKEAVCSWLGAAAWPGGIRAVESVIERFGQRVDIVATGVNIDARENGVGSTLGLSLIVREGSIEESRNRFDGRTDWRPLLQALRREECVAEGKVAALAEWISKPVPLFAKSGRYVLLRGIHHVKLVVSGEGVRQVKAYVFMALSSADAY